MARLYPPVTEETLPAFCLIYNDKGEKVGATIKINFQMNQAVAASEITGIALRLRTISTNDYVVTEALEKNPSFGEEGLSEGFAMDYNLNNGIAIFSITNEYNPLALEKLRVGQYYKAQLAYIGLDDTIGYWSTVAAIKCVAEPQVTIEGYQSNDVNIFSNEIIGQYQQDITSGDTTEKVYSYKFTLYDTDGETVYDETKTLIHNSSNDSTNNLSNDTFYCYKELEKNKIYYLIYSVTTINGLEVSSPIYQVTNIGSIPPEDDIGLFVFNGTESNYPGSEDWRPFEEGIIKLYIDFNTANDRLSQKTVTGNFVITRSSSKDNFTSWQEVRRFRLGGVNPSSKIIYDYTVEQGVSYRYAVQQFNRQHFYSDKVYAYERDEYFNLILNDDGQPIIKEIKADFEDMFLYDGERQLKIRFNPKISSFKNDLQEQKVDTIGSKYPFIFRNGNVCYKEFTISGLISFQQDSAYLFISDNDYNQMNLQRFETKGIRYQPPKENYIIVSEPSDRYNNKIILYKKELVEEPIYNFDDIHEDLKFKAPISYKTVEKFIPVSTSERRTLSLNQLYKISYENNFYDINRNQTYSKTDLTSDNIASERYFKLSILDWLTDGKPKLFRSPAEGNYIVRLLNVSLSPSDQLGRMLHTFSCTAYEIADFDYNSLKEFGLLTIEDKITEAEYEWFTSNVKTLINSEYLIVDDDNENYYNVDIGNNQLFSFECINFAPGDKIRITTESNPIPMIITIGQTGTYIYEDGERILSLSICPSGGWGGFSRDISLKTKGYKYRPFDMIASINLHTQYGEQIIGKMNNFFAPTVVQSNHDIADQMPVNYYTKKYYEANNVSLAEDFIPINREEMSEELFGSGTFYTHTGRGKNIKYFFANTYNENEIYSKRIQKGTKLMPFDLLYLHAKKREVIPIFASFPATGGLSNQSIYFGDGENDALFSLTPFGNGYVKYSSICKTKEWVNSAILTENGQQRFLNIEERQKAYSVKDLVDLSFSQVSNLDKFCLFELYVPNNDSKRSDKATEWIPYYEATYSIENPDYYSGIFDPYLYNEITKNPKLKQNESTVNYPGWWTQQIEGKYDPSFTISYGEYGDKITEYISLQDDTEITLKNLELPSDLSTNNGVVIELIYRIKYIDYTIEAEKTKIFDLKDEYVRVKEKASKAMSAYRFAQYGTLIRKALTNQPSSIASRLNLGEDYRTILSELTKRIRTDQIEKIERYLKSESNLILNLAFELKNIGEALVYDNNIKNLLAPLGIDDIDDNTYMQFIQNSLNSIKQDSILPQIDTYVDSSYIMNAGGTIELAIQKATREIKQKINFYLQNQDNNIWDFNKILNNILDETVSGSIADKKNKKSEILASMGSVRYTSQYIELLTENKVKKFFNTINPKINGIPIYTENYKVGDLLNKKLLPAGIEDKPVQYINWAEYFHIEDSDPIYSLLGALSEKINLDNREIIYSIDNLDNYSEENSGLLFTTNINGKEDNLLKLIQEQLNNLNDNYNISSSSTYESKYGIGTFNPNNKPILLEGVEGDELSKFILLKVCNINESGQLVKISNSVETVLDNLFLRGAISSSMDNELLKESLIKLFKNSQNYLSQMPDFLLEDYVDIIIRDYIKSNLRDLYQKAYTYQTYYDNYNSNFTDNQANYLQDKIEELIGNITKSNTILNNSLETFRQKIQIWKTDWENTLNNSAAIELKEELNNYIEVFNQIIKAKNDAISTYKTIQEEISFIQSPESNINLSDNIREKYWEEWKAYDDTIKQVEQLKMIFEETYNQLQKDNYIIAYPEFIKDYLLNYNYDEENENIDNSYQEYVQQLIQYSNLWVDEEKSTFNQKQNMINKWKAFLDALADQYKKMS